MKLTANVDTLCLPPKSLTPKDFDGQVCLSSGWGKNSFGELVVRRLCICTGGLRSEYFQMYEKRTNGQCVLCMYPKSSKLNGLSYVFMYVLMHVQWSGHDNDNLFILFTYVLLVRNSIF